MAGQKILKDIKFRVKSGAIGFLVFWKIVRLRPKRRDIK